MKGHQIRIDCQTDECANYMVIHKDEREPKDWRCSTCRDRDEHQMLVALEHADLSRKPLKEF